MLDPSKSEVMVCEDWKPQSKPLGRESYEKDAWLGWSSGQRADLPIWNFKLKSRWSEQFLYVVKLV